MLNPVAPTRDTQQLGGRRRLPLRLGAALLVGVLFAAWWLGAPALASVAAGSGVVFTDETEDLVLGFYGPQGTHFVRYEDGAYAHATVTVVNRGRVGVTLDNFRFEGDQLALATVVPENGGVSIAPDSSADVELLIRFDNCEYYHEREVQVHDGVMADVRVLGRTTSQLVEFQHPVLVRSPTINRCPERYLDRNILNRTDVTRR